MTDDRRDDEAGLEAFFAAARDRRAEPPARLLDAVLADAASAAAAADADADADGVPVVGWRTGAAMAASLLLGFWLGASGLAPLPDGGLWPDGALLQDASSWRLADLAPADGAEGPGYEPDAAAFFDLVLEEG